MHNCSQWQCIHTKHAITQITIKNIATVYCSQSCSGTSVFIIALSQHQNDQRIVMRTRKKMLENWHEIRTKDSKPKCSSVLPCEVCSEFDEYEREEPWLVKQRKYIDALRNDHILVFGGCLKPCSLLQCLLCHLSHTAHTLVHMPDCPKSMCHVYHISL